ncbi:MAG: helix-turn-helix domain-containing protein [Gallionellaceae bacterium]
MENQKKTPAGRLGGLSTSRNNLRGNSNSAHDQRQRLLARLRSAPADTITLRGELDILMPAARIHELKKRGHNIDTVWINRATDCGKLHRVALYVLKTSEASHE